MCGSPPRPPCSLPAQTQLKLITYREYQRPRKAPRSPASLPPCSPRTLAEPQDFGRGVAEGGSGGQRLPQRTQGPHSDPRSCLLISTSQMLLGSATGRQIPEGEGSMLGREEMKAEKGRIY